MSATTSGVRHPGDTDDILGRARSRTVEPSRSLFQRILGTDARLAPTIARLSLGLVMLPHALQKTAGWFGGNGFGPTYEGFMKMGIPGPLAIGAIVAELAGALLLISGLLTRLGALAIIGVMLGAIALVHVPHGFFMNWAGTQAGEGFEYHLLAIALGVVCLLEGGGRASIDRALTKRRRTPSGTVGPAIAVE